MEKTRGDPHAGVPKDRRAKKGKGKGRAAAAVAIIIVIILAAGLLLPALSRSRESGSPGPVVRSRSHLRQLGLALNMYAQDYEGQQPPSLHTLVDEGYVTNPYLLVNPRGEDYGYLYMYYAKPLPDEPDVLKETRVVAETVPDGEVQNVLYLDGHVEWSPKPPCMSSQKEFGLALNMYAQDYEEGFPKMFPDRVEPVRTPEGVDDE